VDDSEPLWNEWRQLLGGDAPDPLEVARLASTFERYFDAVKTEAVKAARAGGQTWEDVATAVGTTRQSAWERYRRYEKMKSGQWLEAGLPFAVTRGGGQAGMQ
jgi:hypothetical protein